MSEEVKLKEQVVEQPDSVTIPPPADDAPYHHIEPFLHLSEQPLFGANKVLLILNQRIDIDLISLCKKCDIIVCADGGANQLYDYFPDEQSRIRYLPCYIVGDFDSLRPQVKSYYESRGCIIIPQSTQYSNDFMKCIYCIQLHYELKNTHWHEMIDTVNGLAELWESIPHSNHEVKLYVLNAIGGRFDQSIQSINQLYILNQSYPNLSLFFITAYDVIFLLKKGENYVTYESRSVFCKEGIPSCGLLPMGDKCVVLNTFGLKYDVREWTSQMLGKVSSSNSISGEDGFIVNCSDDIVMNIEITK
ncbi:Thiamine pyrophosphokinase [Candida viswanathii]|uniref:Thiamine pyrophosphokinase n=1 Tax=Candida viswanathii TaxID=5486 RepID=A0A367Y4L3_9ASCO|nr:Thiamine pyrophosphokinase [Candida viswanathii]